MVVNGDPGFTNECFEALCIQVEESGQEGVIINLVVDEMSIRQQVEWDDRHYHGYVDFGSKLEGDGDERSEAKLALVFMAVCLNGLW